MKSIFILIQLLGGISLVPWAFALMLSPMLFDSPDSTRKIFPYLIIGCLLLYPVLVGLCYWYAWKMEDMRVALFAASLPIILDIIVFLYIMSN